MKKLIVTMATENILSYCQEILDTQREYCARHGIEHRLKTEPYWTDMHPSFSKVRFIHEALEEGYDQFMWMDADIAVTNQAYELFALLDPDYYLACYQQTNWKSWAYLCNGFMIWRNTQQAKDYVTKWMAWTKERTMLDPPWEQWGSDLIQRETNWANIRCCTGDEIGCFSKEIWHDGTIWKEGMPTVHLGGPATWERRREVFLKHYQPLIKR